jgi:hypothetical protein
MGLDSSVSIALSYGVRFTEPVIFVFFTDPRPALTPTHPPIPWVLGDLFLALKRQGREADHLIPSRTQAKKDGAILLLPASWQSV